MKKKYSKSPGKRFPLFGTITAIIAVISIIVFWNSIQTFFTLQEGLDKSEDISNLVGNIFVFSAFGSSAIGVAIISFIVMIITIPLSIVLISKRI